jgi:gamma-glutamylputrescine oxidase
VKVGIPIWWDTPIPRYPPFPGGSVRADVAVIGAGFSGLSVAYHLLQRRPGLRVVVLEADHLGAGASGRNTGMLGPGVGQSLASLVRKFGPAKARTLYQTTLSAVEDTYRLIEAEHIDCELERSGQLIVARGANSRRRLAALAALLRQLQLPHETLDADTLQRVLRLTPAAPAALRLPIAGILHPLRLLAGLAARVTALGGAIYEKARVGDLGCGRLARLAIAAGGEVIAADAVAATAGYTPALGLLRGRLLPLHLQALATEPLSEAAFRRIGWMGREGVLDSRHLFNYFRLTADNRLVFGGGRPRYHGATCSIEDGSAQRALDCLAVELRRTFPMEAGLRIARGWTGVIGYTLDGLPAIQRVPDRPGVLHVVGWCGHGLALALAAGAWVTSMLCDGAVPEDLPWFRARPPRIPFEPLRRLGFRLAVEWMALLDGNGPPCGTLETCRHKYLWRHVSNRAEQQATISLTETGRGDLTILRDDLLLIELLGDDPAGREDVLSGRAALLDLPLSQHTPTVREERRTHAGACDRRCVPGCAGQERPGGGRAPAPVLAAGRRTFDDAPQVGGRLVASGLLTQFQAEQLLQGKYRGFTLGKYKVLERIGSGGHSNVYLCEHRAEVAEHAVFAADRLVEVGNQGIFQIAETALLAGRLDSGEMAIMAVHRSAEYLIAALLELRDAVAEGDDLRRADEREIQRIEEQNDVLAAILR